MKIILVTTGNFQEYIINNIINLQKFNNNDITVITETLFFPLLEKYNVELIDSSTISDSNFNQTSCLDKNSRNGFWHLCSLRLFYVYSYIKKYNKENCIHLENDVMTYINFDEIKNNFKYNKVYATFDCENRVIPGLIYIPNYLTFEPIINNYSMNLNDMENLAKHDENIIIPLPIIDFSAVTFDKLNKYYNDFKCIFDAAAMGQYLGGIDPINQPGDTRGFINETCLIKYNNYQFYWLFNNGLYLPYILINGKLIKVINLHIHSKRLNDFMATHPNENKLIKIIF